MDIIIITKETISVYDKDIILVGTSSMTIFDLWRSSLKTSVSQIQ